MSRIVTCERKTKEMRTEKDFCEFMGKTKASRKIPKKIKINILTNARTCV